MFLETPQGKIFYEQHGHEGAHVTHVHGRTLDHRMWNRQVECFDQTYRILTYDLRGFGQSDIPNEEYSRHEDLFLLLNHLNILKTNLIGLSLGGDVALDFVLEYPNRVEKLVLLSSGVGGWNPAKSELKDIWNEIVEIAKVQGIDAAKQAWINSQLFSTIPEDSLERAFLQDILKDYTGWDILGNNPRIRPEKNAIERLAEIKVPTLIIAGEKDVEDFVEIAEFLNLGIQDSRLVIVPKASHMVNLENPRFVNHEILKFLQEQ